MFRSYLSLFYAYYLGSSAFAVGRPGMGKSSPLGYTIGMAAGEGFIPVVNCCLTFGRSFFPGW